MKCKDDKRKTGGWKHSKAYYTPYGKYYCPSCDEMITGKEAVGERIK